MKAVFADTSFFVAFLNPRDTYHMAARAIMAELCTSIITTEWVLAELGSALCRGSDRGVFLGFLEDIRNHTDTKILPADSNSFEEGRALFSVRSDKDWSLIDCISFSTMRQLSLTEALTADHHFQQAGFNTLLC